MSETKEQVLEVLEEVNPGVDYETTENLITDRHIDSLTMVALIPELEDAFDIEIPAVEIVADNFNTLDAIVSLVDRLCEEDD